MEKIYNFDLSKSSDLTRYHNAINFLNSKNSNFYYGGDCDSPLRSLLIYESEIFFYDFENIIK